MFPFRESERVCDLIVSNEMATVTLLDTFKDTIASFLFSITHLEPPYHLWLRRGCHIPGHDEEPGRTAANSVPGQAQV